MADINGFGTNVPSQDLNGPQVAGSINFMEKYGEERGKRLREGGLTQYIDLHESEKFRHFLEDPFIPAGTPINRPVPDGGHTKVLIVGAGYSGILFAVRLIHAGFKPEDVVIVDPAGGFGGTWYWNRYPGLMCDVESYIYLPLLEEMNYMPKRKYASGEEIRKHAENIGSRYNLYDRAQFQSSVKTVEWDDTKKIWSVAVQEEPKGGDKSRISVTADFVFFASGVLNNAKLPDFEGVNRFNGHMFHTARWNYEYTGGSQEQPDMAKLKDKKVAYIGTGATAVQSIPHLAKWAKELYVFQRTPSSVDRRDNRDTSEDEWKSSIAAKPGWWKERNLNFSSFVNNVQPRPEVNMVNDAWTMAPSYSALIGGPKVVTMENVAEHVQDLHAMDYVRTERVRKRTEEIVKDKATAESLKAWYPTWCKRPCFHDEYLQSFNLPNVHLVDTDGKGVSQVSENGVIANGKEYPVDVFIMGTGFVSPSLGTAAGKAHIKVFGRERKSLEGRNSTGDLSTLHGIAAKDFPNMFFPGPLQAAATANQVFVLDQMSTHIAYVIAEATKKTDGKPIIESTKEAQEQWVQRIMGGAFTFAAMAGCTPGYLNREGEADKIPPEARMKAARNAIWGHGIASFLDIIEGWRSDGRLEGLEITAAA